MALVALAVAGASVFMLYRTAFSMEEARLVETAKSQARLVEAVARYHEMFNREAHPGTEPLSTLKPVVEGFRKYEGFGRSGELSLAKKEGDMIVFKLRHRMGGLEMPQPIPWSTGRAEPMRRALTGQSGTITSPDYRGIWVVAAYEPIDVLGLGLVVKIDLAEIRAPFVRAAWACALGALLIVLLGAALLRQISAPFLLRESAERAAKESETRFRDFAEGASDWMWECGVESGFTVHSPKSDPGPEGTVRPAASDLATWEEIGHAVATKKAFRDLERYWTAPDGSARVVRLSGKPVYHQDGAFLGFRGTGSDITAVVEAEARKTEAEHRLAKAMDASPTVFALFDRDDRLVISNRLYRTLYETPLQPVVSGVTFEALVRAFAAHVGIGAGGIGTSGNAEETESWVRKRLARREAPSTAYIYQRGDGEWIEVADAVLNDGSIFTVGTVITQRVQMEAQLRHSQKMDAIGQLTGGVAHDFNNLLAVIQGNLEFAMDLTEPDTEMADPLLTALRAVGRGADLTQHLLAFARSQALRPRALDLDEHVQGTAKLLRRTLGEAITIEIHRGNGPAGCIADPTQLENVLLNLALNARDAMAEGGRVTISTESIVVGRKGLAAASDLAPGRYVVLSVADDGHGMSPDVEERAFEPFFTTKEVGEGSGLGLSMVHGFAKQSGGHVTLSTEPGQGTIVRVYLPSSEAQPSTAAKITRESDEGKTLTPGRLPCAKNTEGHGEVVLLVEDDADVRSLVARMLDRLGYTPLQAADGETALNVLNNGAQVDLMLVDLVLPGPLTGLELADRASRRKPDLKVLFCSGYDPNAALRRDAVHRGQILHKPFDRRQLADAVASAISARSQKVLDGSPLEPTA